jgi:hypothetical protein
MIGIVVADSSEFNVYDIVDESVSGYRGIIIYIDSGTDTIYIIFTDDGSGGVGGFFTSGRTLSVISGGSVSSSISANTKNVDTYSYHMLGVPILDVKYDGMISIDGTDVDAFSMFNKIVAEGSGGNHGTTVTAVDNNSFRIQCHSGSIGRFNLSQLSIADSSRVVSTEDWYYENDFTLK